MPHESEVRFRVKQEGTYGADPTADSTNNVILLDWDIKPDIKLRHRPVSYGYDALLPAHSGGRLVAVKFATEIKGRVAADPLTAGKKPLCAMYLEAAGWVFTWDAGTSSWIARLLHSYDAGTDQKSLWLEASWGEGDGELLKVAGLRGKSKLVFKSARGNAEAEPGLILFEGFGMMDSHGTGTLATTAQEETIDAPVPPLCGGGSCLPFGIVPAISSPGHVIDVEVDPRYNLRVGGSASCTAAQDRYGISRIRLCGRGTQKDPGSAVKMRIEQGDDDGWRWWDYAERSPVADTGGVATIYNLGETGSNRAVLTISDLAPAAPPVRVTDEGELCFDQEFRALPGPEDEAITLTFPTTDLP